MDNNSQRMEADPSIFWLSKVIADMRAQIEMQQARLIEQERELQQLRPEQMRDGKSKVKAVNE